ncbi:molybdenum ABC transporter substrate-binding protein [Pedobacter sp. Leaf216]|uniref:molybdate ABC transporter substrate-binding protein n=1 Tax=Pedobacter sp. Leaf216 TaxID=1735684 RepID=UPI0006F55C5B|nr:molybdate ABC transporter substrate-binding protein [Pedobacter sp. Leaf216]KQM72637.1 molybdenum ABC transporter substrate-binding protein [Pedobacter sp. Leaf216]
MNPFKIVRIGFLLLIFLAVHFCASAQKLRIAVAANAQGLIKKLQLDFKKQTGIETEAIIGASGKLTAQIMNGAPYDLFLSADTEFPEKLFKAGYGIKKPKIYALGSLIVCSTFDGDISNWQAMIKSEQVKKVAIANPKTAPYGRAAQESLKFYQLEGQIAPKLVFAESISQVNTYLQTAVVSMGFTTEAFLYENSDKTKLKWTRINPESYARIEQAVILLANANKTGLAKANKFYDYLSSASARKIIASNGYHLPK